MLESYLNIATHPLLWIFIGLTVVFYAVQWVVGQSAEAPTAPDDRIKRLAKRVGLGELHPTVFLLLALTWGIVAATLFVGLYTILLQVIFHAPPEGEENLWNWRFTLAQLAALTTVLGAVIALPLTINRLILTRRQTDTIEQGHITDRINKAVEGLGATKLTKTVFETPRYRKKNGEWELDEDGKLIPAERPDGQHLIDREIVETSEPNLEVRIGAIYALERIAQDSDRDHVQIMEILCAYIRQNAPAPAEDDWPVLEIRESEEDGPLEAGWEERLGAFHEAQREVSEKLRVREDIQVALTVIGRRSEKQRWLEAGRGAEAPFPFDTPCPYYAGPEDDHDPAAQAAYRNQLDDWNETLHAYDGYRLDLRGADLRGADLSGLNLNGTRLDGTHLQGAVLWQARLQGAVLRLARLHGAVLWQARLQGAILTVARLQGADLGRARLQGADLRQARLQGADLREARLQGARLMGARLQGASFTGACLQGASLAAARLQGAHLVEARLQGADLMAAQFDPKTVLAAATLRGAAAWSVDFNVIPRIRDHPEGMFGDGSVTLPEGCDRPAHWPRHALEFSEFHDEWHKWQADPEGYTPPHPPDKAA